MIIIFVICFLCLYFSDEVEKHLEECASDNLIAVTRKVGQKGSKVGIEQEGFRLPTPPVGFER